MQPVRHCAHRPHHGKASGHVATAEGSSSRACWGAHGLRAPDAKRSSPSLQRAIMKGLRLDWSRWERVFLCPAWHLQFSHQPLNLFCVFLNVIFIIFF